MVSLISEKRPVENGDSLSTIVPPKYKRRKVSAVRDFPPGCGRNAAPISVQLKEVEDSGQMMGSVIKDVDSIGGKEGGSCDVDGNEILKKLDESQYHDIPACSNSLNATSNLDKSKREENGNEESLDIDVDMGLNVLPNGNPKFSQRSRNMEEEFVLKDEMCSSSKDFMEVRIKSPSTLKNTSVLDLKEVRTKIKSEMPLEGTNLQLSLLPYHPVPSSVVWKERKYPPRRRVSAIRDFPPGCGCDVQRQGETYVKHVDVDIRDASTLQDVVKSDENQTRGDLDVVGAFEGDIKDVLEESGNELEGQSQASLDTSLEVKKQPSRLCESLEIQGQEETPEVKRVGHHVSFIEEMTTITSPEVNTQPSQIGKLLEIKKQEETSKVKSGEHHVSVIEKKDLGEKDVKGTGDSWDEKNKELIVYVKDKNKKNNSIVVPWDNNESKVESIASIKNEEDMVFVQALMAVSNLPKTKRKKAVKSIPFVTSVKQNKGKTPKYARKDVFECSPNKTQESNGSLGESSMMIVPYVTEIEPKEVSDALIDEGDSTENEELDDFRLVPRRCIHEVSLPPFRTGSLNDKGARNKVRETLRLFHAIVRKLQQGEESKSKNQENANKRVDLRASNMLKAHGKFVNAREKNILGNVPGVEVGDIFDFRIELSIIGLHRPPQAGIDYMKKGQKIIATSIVASGGYANDVDSSDVLIYTGQGGNAKGGDKRPEDQKLERGNLALKNSIDEKNVVRVIRGVKETKSSEKADGRSKNNTTYTYDGLYTVEKYWHDIGPHGKLVYKFELRRVPGQPELAWKEVKRSNKLAVRKGRCVLDISNGEEKLPISAINPIDDEKPPLFTYITRMIYPDWCQPLPPKGCDCKDGCSDSEHCACAIKNGGEIPYNLNGAIVEAKPLLYECGPSCKCSSACHNRVSQAGIKLPLEIFKTESRGWGVRCLSPIPSGSFICEYIGELLDDKEAEQRAGNDEYLFDVGQNYNDPTLWNGLAAMMPDLASTSSDVVENVGFTIDAAKCGNIGRFINHSCSPNLYAQNVLYDHDDKRIPHIMLFAAENIPALQELTYHYNYMIDQVYDHDGNIKKKSCYCGSSECTGRMY